MSESSYTRRSFMKLSGIGGIAAASFNVSHILSIPEAYAQRNKRPQNGEEALATIMEGNNRFVNSMKKAPGRYPERRKYVATGQNPFATILACSDSRVAPEIIFDQGIGDLFVIRVAGNIVDPKNYGIQGSLEFGVLALGVSLIMVLGHSECGAVDGAIQSYQKGTEYPGSINKVVKTIEPAVKEAEGEKGNLLHNATISNVEIGVNKLINSDPIISDLVKKGTVKVVGGNYDLKTGEVKLIS